MKKFIIILLPLILTIPSCKKSTNDTFTPPPGNPNHIVNAIVSVKGGSFTNFTASGNSTVFGKSTDQNGDVKIGILGSNPQVSIHILMVNTIVAGTYPIGIYGGTGAQYITGTFEIGNPYAGPFELFFANSPPPSGQ